jgi:uncharacterized protein (TIGR02452 family)
MNRDERKKMGEETLKIIADGFYYSSTGQRVDIKSDLDESLKNTKLYKPEDFDKVLQVAQKAHKQDTGISVTNSTSLEATKTSLGSSLKVCCLNFASAKNPGGGFLNGSQAQEESLARSSGLYHSISAQQEMYEYNRNTKNLLYSDYMIYSPEVPIFRDDTGKLLEKPYKASFITSPAVNAGAIAQNQKHDLNKIIPVMKHRAKYILLVAAENKCDVLILGAWGCGVFRNDPQDIATIFYDLLKHDNDTANLLKEVVFAIYDSSAEKATLNTFLERFKS